MKSADLSTCGRYRYRLERHWDDAEPLVTWIMLNPSTADATIDDPTIRKCIGFARRWGAGGIIVVNLFAFRATNPKALKPMREDDATGGEINDEAIAQAVTRRRVKAVVAAWGVPGQLFGRDGRVLDLLTAWRVSPLCLGLTGDGIPRHPLYVPYARLLTEVPHEGAAPDAPSEAPRG